MAKTKISEFSSTPGNNTDIDGINIAEGCAPSGINNAIRELMSQLKDFQAGTAGDSFNGPVGTSTAAAGAFTTLSASGAVTLSGGTANGVPYLNGSKVLTTGSALTFDGTRLTSITGKFGGGAAANSASLMVNNATNTATGIQLFQDGIESWIMGMPANSAALTWSASGAEQMRLTSTGLGIGTSSPAGKVHASNSYSNSSDLSFVAEANIPGYNLRSSAGGRLSLVTGFIGANISSLLSATGTSNPSDELMRFNHSSRDVSFLAGNLGVGTAPASGTSARLHVAGTAVGGELSARIENLDSSSAVSEAGLRFMFNGALKGYIGTINGSGGASIMYFYNNGAERARINSSGNFFIGGTSLSNDGRLNVIQDASTNEPMCINDTSTSSAQLHAISFQKSGTEVGSIRNTNTTTSYITSSDYRLKNITGPITTSGAYIDSLKPVEGTWKADGSTFVGLIAHEVQEASRTQVATGVKDGEEMQGMDYSNSEIIANLIAEVKALRARVAALESN